MAFLKKKIWRKSAVKNRQMGKEFPTELVTVGIVAIKEKENNRKNETSHRCSGRLTYFHHKCDERTSSYTESRLMQSHMKPFSSEEP